MRYIELDTLEIGRRYERPYLAALWGYGGYQAISRGVITPKGQNLILLFVTHEKQESLTQYDDYIDGNLLYWEGEEKHGSDTRIVSAADAGDEIHLFYREVHHTPFEYKGRIELESAVILADKPSEFVFRLHHDQSELDDIATHARELEGVPETVRETIIDARKGQGRFRRDLFRMWRGCSVTGVDIPALILASHIKPWRLRSR